ncbi:MAG: LA_2272 family surface repeat-containing protein [Chitinophagaceae bacterium]
MIRIFLLLFLYGVFFLQTNSQEIDSSISSVSTRKVIVKPINLSLVYPVCIYGKKASKNDYYFSFNILVGKVNNVRILEIAGLYNLDQDVKLIQVAGLFNKVNNIAGIQIAGICNIVKDEATAIQLSGLTNIIKKEALGIRVAGLGNLTYRDNVGIEIGGIGNIAMGEFTGIQLGGLFNYSRKQAIGLQIAGVFNYAKHDAMGLQLSLLTNISMNLGAGLQITGLMNIMNNYSGLEIAGLSNISLHNTFGFSLSTMANITMETFKGIQVSLFNYVGRSSNGIQVGLLNYADTVGNGLSLGLINIIKKGRYSEVEFTTSNTSHITVNYKSGLKKLYNIYGVGYYFSNNPFIHFGLGLGGKYSFNKHVSFQPEMVSYIYFHPNNFSSYFGNTTNFNLGIAYDINHRFSIIVAPTLYINTEDKKNNIEFDRITSYTKPFYKSEIGNKRTLVGIGYKIGFAIKL